MKTIFNECVYQIKNYIYFNLCRIKYYIDRLIYKKPNVLSIKETISRFGEEDISCGRYGDGEIIIVYGGGISFQEANIELAQRLREILSLTETEEHFLVCLPDIFDGLQFCKKEAKKFHYDQLVRWYKKWCLAINPNRVYYSAFSSRFYSLYKKKTHCREVVEIWKQVWNKKRLLIVEGEFSRLGIGNDLFDNAPTIGRILCPSHNAWSSYEKILKTTFEVSDKYDMVLVALGPTATVLCYDLYKNGIKALDVGHIDVEYEWYKLGTKKRVAVAGKFVNEVKDDSYLNYSVIDEKYEKQILVRITNDR